MPSGLSDEQEYICVREGLLSSTLRSALQPLAFLGCVFLTLQLSAHPAAAKDADRARDCVDLAVEFPNDKRVAVITNKCDEPFLLFWVNTNCDGMICRAEIPPAVTKWKLATADDDPFASVYRLCNMDEHPVLFASGDFGDCLPD